MGIIIETKAQGLTHWNNLQLAVTSGDAQNFLKVGDRIAFDLKDGTKVAAIVAHLKENEAYFVMEDTLPERRMYEKRPNGRVTWKDSDLRKWMNSELFALLPDDLAEVIADREITQRIGGEVITCTDKLWAPSMTEMFEAYDDGVPYHTDGAEEFHFDLFKGERSRVKELTGIGETWWYWLRSASADSSAYFRIVYFTGSGGSNIATTASSVCFGFCIK